MGSNQAPECGDHGVYNISEQEMHHWIYSPSDIIIITVITPIFMIIGVVTNSTFLFVIFRNPLRSTTNTYLTHLAVCDLTLLLIISLGSIWSFVRSPKTSHPPWDIVSCIVFNFIVNCFIMTSTSLITMVSLERYMALCHPIKHLKIRSGQRTNIIIGLCWLVGLVIAGSLIPASASTSTLCLQWPDNDVYQGYPSTVAYCTPIQKWALYYTLPLATIPYFTAMVGSIYMYIRIMRTLKRRTSRLMNHTIGKEKRESQLQNRVAKMLILNGAVFFICQTPWCVINLWIYYIVIGDEQLAQTENSFTWIYFLPSMLNTAVNPLIYGTMNKQYRTAFVHSCRCFFRHRHKEPALPSLPRNTAPAVNAGTSHPINEETLETKL